MFDRRGPRGNIFESSLTKCVLHYSPHNRRCAIFLASLCARRRFVAVGAVEYYVRWSLVVVLVHYTPRIQITTVLEQYGSLLVPYCSRLPVPLGYVGGISAWTGLQRGSSHGTLLFHVGKILMSKPKLDAITKFEI